MAQFIKAGKSIINIDAIARIEDLSITGGMAEVNVHLSNGQYVVVRDAEACALLDFFSRRTTGGTGTTFSACSTATAGDVPSCSRN